MNRCCLLIVVSLVTAAAWCSQARADVNVTSWSLTTLADNASGGSVFATDSTVSLPFSFTRSVVDGANTSTAQYDFAVAGGDASFDFAFTHVRSGTFGSDSECSGSLTFTVTDCDVQYDLSGAYALTGTRSVGMTVALKDETTNTFLFRNVQVSQQTLNESFTLGQLGGDQGGSNAVLLGSLSGTLPAGHTFTLSYGYFTFAFPSADSGASATGNLSLTTTGSTSPPTISVPPGDLEVCEGDDAVFTVAATGAGVLEYQWQKDGDDLLGENADTLVISPVTAGDAGSYTVVVSNSCGSITSDPADLIVDAAGPVITLIGAAEMTLECHVDSYVEPGANATDECDGSVPVVIDGDAVNVDSPDTYVVTYDATDSSGHPAAQVTRTVTVEDTLPPTIVVDTTPITVTDSDCSGGATVMLPAASAFDECDPDVTVTNDAPAVFPAGQTTLVTFSAADDAGNPAGDVTLSVTVRYGASVQVAAGKHFTGIGPHPACSKQPLTGLTVYAYPFTAGSCAYEHNQGGGNITWQEYEGIVADCTPLNSGVTGGDGKVTIDLPPGDYLLIAPIDTDDDNAPDKFLAAKLNDLECGQSRKAHLKLIVDHHGKKRPCKVTRLTGSELLIVEPEYIVWDGTEQLYPFVLETVGDWGVTASVEPPDGFVSDYPELSAQVTDEMESLQFTITEVGSDLVPTRTAFRVTHNGRVQVVQSNVGIMLTAEYAAQRGFNVDELRARGQIVNPTTPVARPAAKTAP